MNRGFPFARLECASKPLDPLMGGDEAYMLEDFANKFGAGRLRARFWGIS